MLTFLYFSCYNGIMIRLIYVVFKEVTMNRILLVVAAVVWIGIAFLFVVSKIAEPTKVGEVFQKQMDSFDQKNSLFGLER